MNATVCIEKDGNAYRVSCWHMHIQSGCYTGSLGTASSTSVLIIQGIYMMP